MKFQWMLEDVDTREKVAHPPYKHIDELDFQILLTDNYYVNPSNIHLCFPMRIKTSNEANDIDDDLMTVNNFFAHLIKEISITKYGSDKELIPTFSPYEIYQYSDSMLKHLKTHWKSLKKHYSKQAVYFHQTTINRRIHYGSDFTATGLNATQIATSKNNNAKDLNIDEWITKFKDQLKDEYVYRIPLKYFTDLGKMNFPLKMDFRIKCHLEKDMKILYESKNVLAANSALPSPDAKIIFTKAPFIQYQQLLLDKNFRQYLETVMVSKKILRMGAQKTLIQKTYEISTGQDSLSIDFLGANRQFDWIEISIVYGKSEKHNIW